MPWGTMIRKITRENRGLNEFIMNAYSILCFLIKFLGTVSNAFLDNSKTLSNCKLLLGNWKLLKICFYADTFYRHLIYKAKIRKTAQNNKCQFTEKTDSCLFTKQRQWLFACVFTLIKLFLIQIHIFLELVIIFLNLILLNNDFNYYHC